ncbi:MAG: DUF1653 domain-containing protein [Clostridia bacterium]|nr:DUF1653 domain-containing protein [Clostridia bacterium]
MEIKIGTYRHFKGGMYKVVAIALHSENLEEMVVYQNIENGKCWVRPASMWDEKVEYEGKTVSRFTFIEE